MSEEIPLEILEGGHISSDNGGEEGNTYLVVEDPLHKKSRSLGYGLLIFVVLLLSSSAGGFVLFRENTAVTTAGKTKATTEITTTGLFLIDQIFIFPIVLSVLYNYSVSRTIFNAIMGPR